MATPWRKTTQDLVPATYSPQPDGHYDLYPAFPLTPGQIELGHRALAERLLGSPVVIIDGFGGVLWERVRQLLGEALEQLGVQATWTDVSQALRRPDQIDSLVQPFLGGDDPLFGTRFTGTLADFFDPELLASLRPDPDSAMTILYGSGAALAGWDGLLVYVDIPKNEIQFRSRAGSITNLGAIAPEPAKAMYKRFYFVDWIALNQHKADLLPQIDLIVDEQRPHEPAFMSGAALRAGLTQMSHNYFRVRPWFEPGPWGGQWIKETIPQLPQDPPNYAWSFELIVPENGLLFASNDNLLEVSFDFLMYYDHQAVLGESAGRFGYEFPIRFDFLDTIDGGNLSVQVHPRPEFIQEHFGERFTQDETYYILDCQPGAEVYLGFVDPIDPDAFRRELERSMAEKAEIDIRQFVNTEPANKHDLFLIPNGTIHCSGAGNMVLEISATPYIFTFKMYDWMRLDLEGNLRPLNLDRAFQNLCFDRRGKSIREELVPTPALLAQGEDWRILHLPTHSEHFYDVHRFEFSGAVQAETNGSCHIMSLVEGRSVILETANGMRQRFSYAETFVVPAAASSYRLTSEDGKPCKVIKAFVKGRTA